MKLKKIIIGVMVIGLTFSTTGFLLWYSWPAIESMAGRIYPMSMYTALFSTPVGLLLALVLVLPAIWGVGGTIRDLSYSGSFLEVILAVPQILICGLFFYFAVVVFMLTPDI